MTVTRSVLLDLDGTLIDSQPGILASCLAALRALGHEPDATRDISGIIGPPIEEMMAVLLQPYGDGRIRRSRDGLSATLWRKRVSRQRGLSGHRRRRSMRCSGTGLRIYLATSKRKLSRGAFWTSWGFTAYFDGIYGSVPGGALDHKPELLAHIVSRHDLLPAQSLMVGDRRYDISGAHAVGMRGLGVLWGYGSGTSWRRRARIDWWKRPRISPGRCLRWSAGRHPRTRFCTHKGDSRTSWIVIQTS